LAVAFLLSFPKGICFLPETITEPGGPSFHKVKGGISFAAANDEDADMSD
jgi:hypothetical protein